MLLAAGGEEPKEDEREKEDEEAAGAEPKEKVEDVVGAAEAPNSDVEPKADCDAGCDWPKLPKLKPLPVPLPNEPNDIWDRRKAVGTACLRESERTSDNSNRTRGQTVVDWTVVWR